MKIAHSDFDIDQETGLLASAIYKASPHCDERPLHTEVDLLVIHSISLPPNQFGGEAIENFFCGVLDIRAHPFYATIAELKVSAHLLIKRQGEIIQFVPFHKRAWHAGVSQYQNKTRCNDFSIGIELEGAEDIAYEPVQYQQLAGIIQCLQRNYSALTKERIVGHSDIAPGRKRDPGPAFNWGYLKGLLR